MTAFQNEQRVCRKSSVYNQTGETYFQQLSAYNHMSAHLRRVLLAPCVVDCRNKRYMRNKQLDRNRFSNRSKSLDKIRAHENFINGLVYNTEDHPLDVLRMSLGCSPDCTGKVKRACEPSTRSDDWNDRSRLGGLSNVNSQRMAIVSEADGIICPCFRPPICKPCSTPAPKRGSSKGPKLTGSSRKVTAPQITNRNDRKRSSSSEKGRSRKPTGSRCNTEEAEPAYTYDSSFESASENTSVSGSPTAKKSESDRDSPSEKHEIITKLLGRQKKNSEPTERTEEAKYAKFIYDITQEIMQNGSFTDHEMNEIFKKHIDLNSGTLDKNKMQSEIYQLKLSLNVSERGNIEEDEDPFAVSGNFANFSPKKPPTPPKMLDEKQLAEKLGSYDNAIHKPTNAHGKNTVVLVDANPELVITERDVLVTLMEMNLEPRQIQSICKSLQSKSRESVLSQTVQVDAQSSRSRKKEDRANSPIHSRTGSRVMDFYRPCRDDRVSHATAGTTRNQLCQCCCSQIYTTKYSVEESQTEVQPKRVAEGSYDSRGDENRVPLRSSSSDRKSVISTRTKPIRSSEARKTYEEPEIDVSEVIEEKISRDPLLEIERVSSIRDGSRDSGRLASIKSKKKRNSEEDEPERISILSTKRSTLMTGEAVKRTEDLSESRMRRVSDDYDEEYSSEEKMPSIDSKRSTLKSQTRSEGGSIVKSREFQSTDFGEDEDNPEIDIRRSTTKSQARIRDEDGAVKSIEFRSGEFDEDDIIPEIDVRRNTTKSQVRIKSVDGSDIKSREFRSGEFGEDDNIPEIDVRRSTAKSQVRIKSEAGSTIKSREFRSGEFGEEKDNDNIPEIDIRRSTVKSQVRIKDEAGSVVKSRDFRSGEFVEDDNIPVIDIRRSTAKSQATVRSEGYSTVGSQEYQSEEFPEENDANDRRSTLKSQPRTRSEGYSVIRDRVNGSEEFYEDNEEPLRRSASKSQPRIKSEAQLSKKSRESQSVESGEEEESENIPVIDSKRSTLKSQTKSRSDGNSYVKNRENLSQEYIDEEEQLSVKSSTLARKTGESIEDYLSARDRVTIISDDYPEENFSHDKTPKISTRRVTSASQARSRSEGKPSMESREILSGNIDEDVEGEDIAEMEMRKSIQKGKRSENNSLATSKGNQSDEEPERTSEMSLRRGTSISQARNRSENDSYVTSRGNQSDEETERISRINSRRGTSASRARNESDAKLSVRSSENRRFSEKDDDESMIRKDTSINPNENQIEDENISKMDVRKSTSTQQTENESDDDSSDKNSEGEEERTSDRNIRKSTLTTPNRIRSEDSIQNSENESNDDEDDERRKSSNVRRITSTMQTESRGDDDSFGRNRENTMEEKERASKKSFRRSTSIVEAGDRNEDESMTIMELTSKRNSPDSLRVNDKQDSSIVSQSEFIENLRTNDVNSMPNISERSEIRAEDIETDDVLPIRSRSTLRQSLIGRLSDNEPGNLSESASQENINEKSSTSIITEPSLSDINDAEEMQRGPSKSVKISTINLDDSSIREDFEDEDSDENKQVVVADLKSFTSSVISSKLMSSRRQTDADEEIIDVNKSTLSQKLMSQSSERRKTGSISEESEKSPKNSRKTSQFDETYSLDDERRRTSFDNEDKDDDTISNETQFDQLEDVEKVRDSSSVRNSKVTSQDKESRESFELDDPSNRSRGSMNEVVNIGNSRVVSVSSSTLRNLESERTESTIKEKEKKSICSSCFNRIIGKDNRQNSSEGTGEIIERKSWGLEKERRRTTFVDDPITTISDISFVRKQSINDSSRISNNSSLVSSTDHQDEIESSNSGNIEENIVRSSFIDKSNRSTYLEEKLPSNSLKEISEATLSRKESDKSKKKSFSADLRSSINFRKSSARESSKQKEESTGQSRDSTQSRNSIASRLKAAVGNLMKRTSSSRISSSNVSSMKTSGSQSSGEITPVINDEKPKLPSTLIVKTRKSSCICILPSEIMRYNENGNCRIDCEGGGFVRSSNDQNYSSFNRKIDE